MATGVKPSKFVNYISEFKKVLVTRNNGVITQTFKIDSSIDDNYYFSIVNSNNQLISLEGRVFRIYGSLIDTKQQMHILFYSDRCTIENGTQMHFKIETYTSQYMSWVKSKRIIDLTIVEVANPDAPEEEQTTQVVLRDEAIAYKRPYIENQTPTEILQKVILTTNVPLTGAFGSGHDIDLTIGSDGAAFGTGLKQTGDNQLVIGQYNEADATKAFVIGNGEDDSNRSNAFTVDYQGNVEAKSITVNGQDVGNKVNQLENDIEAVSAAIPSVEGFATEQWVQEQGYLTAHQDLTAYATKDWVEGKGYITGVNLDPYATKDQLTAYATKSDLTVSASVLSNQISQLALNIPTKVSDLTNDAGYLTAVPTSYALKTDIPTGNAQLQNTAGYITGYNAGTGISISNGTISLTGEVGKTYYADNNTLQLNNSTNTFSIKSLSSKLNQGQNILLTPQSDGSVTINAIGGGGGGTGGATYLAGLGLSLSTVSAEDGIYKFYVNEPWLDNKINTATSGIQNLSAGTGLEIEDNVISLTAEIPSIDGLASEQWVETNFLSAIPSNYATKDYVDSSVSGKADLSSVYTKEEVYTYIETDAKINEATSGKADKTELTGLATKDEVQAVDDKFDNYYTSAQVDQAIAAAVEDIPSTVYTGADGIKVDNGVISLTATIPTAISDLTNDSEFATSAQVSSIVEGYNYLSSISVEYNNSTGSITGITLDSFINGSIQNNNLELEWAGIKCTQGGGAEYFTEIDSNTLEFDSDSQHLHINIPDYYTEEVSGAAVEAVTGWVDDQNYLTEIPTSYVQQSELESVSGQLTNAIGAKADTTQVEAEFTATSAWANETFLTEHQSLSSYYTKSEVDSAIGTATNDMATQTWVEEQGYLTAHQSLDDYYNKTEVDTALNLKADSADVYTKTEVNNISTNIVSQIPTDVATSAYVQAASGNAVSVATGWVNDQNYLTEVPSEYITETELATELEPYALSADVTTAITNATSGKADQSTVESLSTALSTAIDTKANSADVYTKSQVYTKGETDTAINTSTSGKVNKTDFDTVTGALSSAIDTKVTSAQVKDQVEAYGYQNATDVANAISGKADKTELQTVSGTLSTAISGVSDRVGAIEADYIKSADMIATSTWINSTFETKANVNNLTGRVKAIEDDYTTSAYVTGQVNALATGAVATNTANIGQLSTDLGNVSGKANANETAIGTLSTDLGTANGNISTLSTDLGTVSGKANTNADNISSLSTRIGTAEGNITTLSTDLGTTQNNITQLSTSVNTISTTYATTNYVNTVSSNLSTELTGWVTENTLTGYTAGSGLEITNDNVIQLTVSVIPSAVSQLVNDSNFITYADIVDGVEYHAGEGLSLINNTFALTGTVLSGDGSTIAINNNVISVIGGGSGGKTYTGGTGIEVDNTNDTISLTATIPTAISDLTNDSQFATSAQVSAIITGYNYLSSITVSYYDQSESRYVQVSAAGLKFTTDFNVTIDSGNNYAWIGWKGLLNMGGVQGAEEFYADHVQWSSEFDVYQSEGGVYVGLVPLSTSQITNDSDYQTAAQVSAIASAYAQGGGGTTYTAGDGIDITNDEISVDQTWFETNVSSLVSGEIDSAASAAVENYIELSGLATGTGLYYDDTDNSLNINLSADANSNMVVSADNNGVVWLSAVGGGETYTAGTGLKLEGTEFSLSAAGANENKVLSSANGTIVWADNVTGGGSTYTAGDYISLTNDTIAVTGLPSQIEYISSVVSAIPTGAEQTNQKTISTGFTYDSKLEIAKNTYTPTDGVVTLSAFEVPAGSLDSNKVATFEEWVYAKDTLTGFAFDGVTLTNELPSEISQTSYYVFTRRILGSGEQFIKYEYKDVDWNNIPLTFKGKAATNAICLSSYGSPDAVNLNYSKNGGEWTTYNINDTITLSANETIAFSGNNNHFSKVWNNRYQFYMTGTIEANGNIQSLMNFSDSVTSACYTMLFNQCTSLITPPILPATTLAYQCYSNMFSGCINMTSAPNLPAITLASQCYIEMFAKCSSIITPPQLPATTLAQSCYRNMFKWCYSLKYAPALPATTLANQCYDSMFSVCTSLTTAPSALPATGTLPYRCYYSMFSDCTSLSTAPQLPATNVNDECYRYMFQGCGLISSITVAFTNWNYGGQTMSWVDGVAANGTFICPTALGTNQTITRGVNFCPNNWTVVNK